MKVLHLVDSAGFYGAEVLIVTLALEQARQGDSPIVCGIIRPGQEESEVVVRARQRGLEAVSLSLHGSFWQQTRMIYEYARIFAVDVIHSHGYRPSILLGLWPGSGQTRVRTLHGWTYSTIFSKIFLYSLVDALLLWRQDSVVAVSNSMRKLPLMCLVPKNKVSYIANGIDISGPIPFTMNSLNDEKWLRLRRDCFVVGSIGRLSREKAQSDMLHAVAILRRKGKQVALVIVGEGEERHALEQLAAELGIAEYVHMPGYLDEAARYMSLFDLFCLSSLTEGLPITVLEAMRQRVAILSTRVGAIPELLADGRGYLVDVGDVMSLAASIEEVMKSPEQKQLVIKSARDHFDNYYSSSIMTEGYRDIYKNALTQKRIK